MILLFVLFIFSMSSVIADSTVNFTNETHNDDSVNDQFVNDNVGERPILVLSPYMLSQLPPVFYGETDLPVGEELTIKITKFPTNEQIVSETTSVLDKNEETKPFFTTPTKGMNKWFFIGNIDDFSFGPYTVNISAKRESISDQNIFRIKE